jgi:protein-tyrosine kinase
MERIKSAIDKARGERLGGPETTRSAAPTPVASPPATLSESWLAALPRVSLDRDHLEQNRVVAYDQSNPTRWVFDLLRTQVLQQMGEKGWRTLAVTSPSVASGKTVVSVNLAMSIAHHPQYRATLVDFDLRRPSVSACLGLPAGTTLSDLLEGDAELKDCLVNVGLPRLTVLPASRPIAGASDVLSSARVAALISQLRTAAPNGITIFDLPPVTAVDDVIAVLPKIDCVLLVAGNGMSTKRELQESQRHLARFNVIGTVLNKAAIATQPGGYY